MKGRWTALVIGAVATAAAILLVIWIGSGAGGLESKEDAAADAAPEAYKFAHYKLRQQSAAVTNPGPESPPDRKVVYTARMVLRVADPRAAAEQAQGVARRHGGYISSAHVHETRQGVYEADIQLRVEASQVEAALSQLRALADRVVSEQLDARDVTSRYVDLEARLENLRRTEKELQVLLTEARESGGKAEDVLAVFSELTEIRERIERYQGQMQVLEDTISLATIDLRLVPEVGVVDRAWSAATTARHALRDLTGSMQWLADAAIFFVICVVPIALMVGVPLLLVLRAVTWAGRWSAGGWFGGH